MEKFSAYRDPGTGIQPFLTPVPPVSSQLLANLTLPLRYLLAVCRSTIVLALLVLYVTLVRGFTLILVPIPPLHRLVTHLLTSILARTTLFVLGFFWIPVEYAAKNRASRGAKKSENWKPQAGDLIISNWVSWIELLWLAIRFDPVFVLPVADPAPLESSPMNKASPITHTPGRRTGTGSANVQSVQARVASTRQPVLGFHQVSLLTIIGCTGLVPTSYFRRPNSRPLSLNEIRRKAARPVVVFPECTTSNGRGLLRFSNVFNEQIPTKNYQVFIMCVRYDPPTPLAPTATHSIPSSIWNPLPHLWALVTSLSPSPISIRLLVSADSPSSPLFVASEVVTGSPDEDQLAEASATLIAQIGKMKRTGLGWEDKSNFLQFYRGKK